MREWSRAIEKETWTSWKGRVSAQGEREMCQRRDGSKRPLCPPGFVLCVEMSGTVMTDVGEGLTWMLVREWVC